jgi:hypothetical protein
MTKRILAGVIAIGAAAALVRAHAGGTANDPPTEQAGQGRTGGGFTSAPSDPATLLFHEAWAMPMAQPMVQESLANQFLTLHIYGNADEIRKTMHPTEGYTYTGETTTNWAITVSDKTKLWDLSRDGRMRLKTRNSGYRFTHIVIKTSDGKYYVSEEGSGESTAWIETDYILSNLRWRNLMMTDTPTNASNRRQPNPKRVPIIPTSVGTPDLTKVDEIGFSDLMAGGWIPATTRVNFFEVYGKAIPRSDPGLTPTPR